MKIESPLDGIVGELLPQDLTSSSYHPLEGFNPGDVSAKDIIGTDDRIKFYNPDYPWSLTGQLVWDKGTVGSAIMIGKRLALTCFHCVDFSSPCYFVPARNTNSPAGQPAEPYGRFKVVQAFFLNIPNRPGKDSNEYGSLDYAVIQLDKAPNIGYAGFSLYDNTWLNKKMWYCVGYPGTWSGQPAFQKNIEIQRVETYKGSTPDGASWNGLKFFTDADSEGGQSGSPLFRIVDKIVYVSGVLSQSGSTDTGFAGCNQFMYDLILWARKNHDK